MIGAAERKPRVPNDKLHRICYGSRSLPFRLVFDGIGGLAYFACSAGAVFEKMYRD